LVCFSFSKRFSFSFSLTNLISFSFSYSNIAVVDRKCTSVQINKQRQLIKDKNNIIIQTIIKDVKQISGNQNLTELFQKGQPLLKAKYCKRAMPVQHFVNPDQLVQAVSCTQKTHTKTPCNLDH